MILFNVVAVWDVYVAAESHDAARAAVDELIKAGELPVSESNALPVRREVEVREAWRDQRILVGADVSDADFEKLKGKTALQVFQMLHTKQPENANKKSKEAANAAPQG